MHDSEKRKKKLTQTLGIIQDFLRALSLQCWNLLNNKSLKQHAIINLIERKKIWISDNILNSVLSDMLICFTGTCLRV